VKDNLTPRVHEVLDRQWEPVYRSCLHYLVSWSTRGRKPVLRDRHALKLRELIPSLCDERGIDLVEMGVGKDRVDLVIGLRPTHSVATAVRELKSRAGLDLLSLYPELRVWLAGHLVWDDRYAVETVSTARLEQARERILADRESQDARAPRGERTRGDRDPDEPPMARAS
jgi:REP element-mobilizing transposase RayT